MNAALHSVLIILTASVCTILTRVAPFALFGRKKEVPGIIKYLGTILPSAIIATLIVYCLRNSISLKPPGGFAEVLSIMVVVILHKWKRNTLLSIAGGTIVYMILIRFVFV
ncbi:MAG TPA: branched-chain amino acid transporter AzlD [Clostridiaceae bacterium]|nr:branched-chain amino acid transporter AzlD [Clostridiaceae bacterium]